MVKTALITGASSGIGRGSAIRLGREGWHILAHGRSENGSAKVCHGSGGIVLLRAK